MEHGERLVVPNEGYWVELVVDRTPKHISVGVQVWGSDTGRYSKPLSTGRYGQKNVAHATIFSTDGGETPESIRRFGAERVYVVPLSRLDFSNETRGAGVWNDACNKFLTRCIQQTRDSLAEIEGQEHGHKDDDELRARQQRRHQDRDRHRRKSLRAWSQNIEQDVRGKYLPSNTRTGD